MNIVKKAFVASMVMMVMVVGCALYTSGSKVHAQDAPVIKISYYTDKPNKAWLAGKGPEDIRKAIELRVNELVEDINEKIDQAILEDKTAQDVFASGAIPFYSIQSESQGKLSKDNIAGYDEGALGRSAYDEKFHVYDSIILVGLNVGQSADMGAGATNIALITYNAKSNEAVLISGKFVEKITNKNYTWEFMGKPITDSFVVGNNAYQNFENGYVKIADVRADDVFAANGGGDATIVVNKNVNLQMDAENIEKADNLIVSNANGAGSIGRSAEKGSANWVKNEIANDIVTAEAFSKMFSDKFDEVWQAGYNPGYTKEPGIHNYYGDTGYKLFDAFEGTDNDSRLLIFNSELKEVFFVKPDFKRGNLSGTPEIGMPKGDEYTVDLSGVSVRIQNFTKGAVKQIANANPVFEPAKSYDENGYEAKPAEIKIIAGTDEGNDQDMFYANGIGYQQVIAAYNKYLNDINDKIYDVVKEYSDTDSAVAALEVAYQKGDVPFYSSLGKGYLVHTTANSTSNIREGMVSRRWEGENIFRNAIILININAGRVIWGDNKIGSIATYNYKTEEVVLVDLRLAPAFPLVKAESHNGPYDPDFIGSPVAESFKVGNYLIQNYDYGYIRLDTSLANNTPELVRGHNYNQDTDSEETAHGNLTGQIGMVNIRTKAYDGDGNYVLNDAEDAAFISKAMSDKYDEIIAGNIKLGFYQEAGIRGFWKHPPTGSVMWGFGQAFYGGDSIANPFANAPEKSGMSMLVYNPTIKKVFLLTDESAYWYEATDESKDTGLPMSNMFEFDGRRYQVFANKILYFTGARSADNILGRKGFSQTDAFSEVYTDYMKSITNTGNKYTSATFGAFEAAKAVIEQNTEMSDADKIIAISDALALLKLAPAQTGIALDIATTQPFVGSEILLKAKGGESNGTYRYNLVSGGTGGATLSGDKLTITKIGTILIKIIKLGDGYYADTDSQIITITITKGKTDKPEIKLIKASGKSISVESAEGCEYSLDGKNWQDSPKFDGLKSGEYKVYMRVKATDFYNASDISELDVRLKGSSAGVVVGVVGAGTVVLGAGAFLFLRRKKKVQ